MIRERRHSYDYLLSVCDTYFEDVKISKILERFKSCVERVQNDLEFSVSNARFSTSACIFWPCFLYGNLQNLWNVLERAGIFSHGNYQTIWFYLTNLAKLLKIWFTWNFLIFFWISVIWNNQNQQSDERTLESCFAIFQSPLAKAGSWLDGILDAVFCDWGFGDVHFSSVITT